MRVVRLIMILKLDGITLQVINMKKFKITLDKKIRLDGVWYKPYLVGDLPPSFGNKFTEKDGEDAEGIYQWFNFKGLTYIKER